MIFRHKRKPTAQEAESQSTYSSSPDTSSSSSSSAARSTLSRRLSLSHTLSSLRPRPPDPDAPPVIKPPGRGIGAHVHKITTTAGIPFNKAAHLVGAEGWFPQTMPRECAKAARILRSFTDQPLGDTEPAPSHARGEPFHPLGVTRRSIVTIPYQVLAHCAGLAIFNTLRAGAYMGSLAAGSGLVVARRPDGTWSPPSSFVVSTLGAGFMFGLDIYDCVLVLNTPAQVAAFTHPRISLGAETSVAIGPVGTGGAVEAAVSRTSRSMYSYMKSRGLWAGVQVDGTIILARQDCNSVAYNERGISARKILQTQAEWPEGSMPLWQTLIALEGRYAMDPDIARELAMMGPPGDFTPPMEEDEEEEPAPAYTPRAAPQFRSTYGGEEGVMNANQNGVEPSAEQKEMMLRRGA
ncbi:Duf500 and uba ts-n domain protein [Colletotrichum higginsianum IMI 349063]|uniref:Duf500 and uba ts-n domain protein n=3 Tax=Colletotrichum higginsianum TaxID=80884 RepID=A0A1B7XWM3_COLHI|nr:Duf500 and uba ts-n domain protein [Colletotrichum higginsianum IMI 349063]OBR04159.1 Duf500 and uba ts-n domain protein [Colletotrichum higginsianum IMI 349063]TIC90159.1 SH3 domain-containing protein [Colletotrichum higginsianum]